MYSDTRAWGGGHQVPFGYQLPHGAKAVNGTIKELSAPLGAKKGVVNSKTWPMLCQI